MNIMLLMNDEDFDVNVGDDEDYDDNVLEPQRRGVVHVTAGLLLY